MRLKRRKRKTNMSKPILYHQNGCGMCKVVEMLLEKKGIEYESCTDLDEMIQKGITGIPTLEVDGQRFIKKECLDWIDAR